MAMAMEAESSVAGGHVEADGQFAVTCRRRWSTTHRLVPGSGRVDALRVRLDVLPTLGRNTAHTCAGPRFTAVPCSDRDNEGTDVVDDGLS